MRTADHNYCVILKGDDDQPVLRGWVNYFAVGHSSECFSFIKDWVEKKVRRPRNAGVRA